MEHLLSTFQGYSEASRTEHKVTLHKLLVSLNVSLLICKVDGLDNLPMGLVALTECGEGNK